MKKYEKPEIESVLFSDTDMRTDTASSQVIIDLPLN